MEVRTFVRIQGVIWDHLLVFKAEIIQKQALIQFPCWTTREEWLWARVNYAVCYVFSFVLVSSPPRSFFRLNHVKKVQKRFSHSRFSFQAIILGFFDQNVGLCCSCFSVAIGDRGYFRWVKQRCEVKDQSSGKGGRTQIVLGSLRALSRARPLAIRKHISE